MNPFEPIAVFLVPVELGPQAGVGPTGVLAVAATDGDLAVGNDPHANRRLDLQLPVAERADVVEPEGVQVRGKFRIVVGAAAGTTPVFENPFGRTVVQGVGPPTGQLRLGT